MGLAHYIVTQRSNGWFILLERERYGPFPSGRISALTAAVQAAHQAGKDGHDARVLLRVSDSAVRTVWAFGTDSYPPRWVERLRLAAPAARTGRSRPPILARAEPSQGTPDDRP